MRIALCLIPLVVIACDSPGGGGGGTVNCSLTPNAPICNPDVTTSDVTNDTTQFETAQPDTTQPDTTQPDTTQPDTTQPDTAQPPECAGSATRCSGNDAQLCNNGFWMTTQTCSGNTTCQNGGCVPTSTCTNGTRRCTGNNVEQCSGGQWVVAETCSNGCANNQCNAPPSGLACDALYDCVFESGCTSTIPPSETCVNTCRAQGTSTTVQQLNAVLSCYNGCDWLAGCSVDNCSQLEANCFFQRTGSRTCTGIFDCLDACSSDDASCVSNCIESGTQTAQGQFLRLNSCMYYFCPSNQLCQECVDAAVACGF